jgi:hypothetical protein
MPDPMPETDRDLVALFAEEPMPAGDPAFVQRVAGEVVRRRAVRVWMTSLAGLALGLGGGVILALAGPLLGEAGRVVGEATRAPEAVWTLFAAGLALAAGVPLWRGR